MEYNKKSPMKQKTISILITILMSMAGTKMYAQIYVKNSDGVEICYYYISDGAELEVGFNWYSGSVVIPEEVTYMERTRKVTSIGNSAFKDCDITSVSIPNSVTNIEDGAFMNCINLKSVSMSMSNKVEYIGKQAFEDCKALTSISFPNIKSLGYAAFYQCFNLTSISLSDNLTNIGPSAFAYCTGITSFSIPNSVTIIDDSAFEGCSGLKSISIPSSVTTIRRGAFSHCSGLTSISIPSSVTIIDDVVFYGCDFQEIVSYIENPSPITQFTFSENTKYNATLFVRKVQLKSIRILKAGMNSSLSKKVLHQVFMI